MSGQNAGIDSTRVTLRVLRINPYTAMRTVAVMGGWHLVEEWLTSHGKAVADVRSHRVNAMGLHTFKCGVGYDVIDGDLLDGDGSGRTRKAFEHETGAIISWR